MPRPTKGARLYLATEYIKDSSGKRIGERKTWLIRDGAHTERTGCGEGDRERAEKRLGSYIAEKFQPIARESDLARITIAEVLTAYGREHAPHTKGTSPANAGYNISTLLPFWGDRTLSDVRADTCRAYIEVRSKTVKAGTIRRELVTLSAAINHWHREHGPLTAVPKVTLPPNPPAKTEWLTRSEVALLLAGALGFYREFWTDLETRRQHVRWKRDSGAKCNHAARFILLGLYTGTRHAAILETQWMPNTVGGWVDLDRGVFHRRSGSQEETKKRRPPARLGRRIHAHLRRWKRMDDNERHKLAMERPVEERDKPVLAYMHVIAYEGMPIQKLRKPWYRAREFSWLEGEVTPHILRHTRATWMMQNGIDPWQAAGYLGMSLKMLEDRYGHHHPDWQKEAAEV